MIPNGRSRFNFLASIKGFARIHPPKKHKGGWIGLGPGFRQPGGTVRPVIPLKWYFFDFGSLVTKPFRAPLDPCKAKTLELWETSRSVSGLRFCDRKWVFNFLPICTSTVEQ